MPAMLLEPISCGILARSSLLGGEVIEAPDFQRMWHVIRKGGAKQIGRNVFYAVDRTPVLNDNVCELSQR
ncbi:hypothetical protein NXC24_PB00178 (plasmid) [Rhizobium sp. NXC24]|nr:hypothetical protein NXC24_PB00178 [Rhizobium sp. NXC24]